MKELKWILHPNHKRALENPKFDIDGYNDGWTLFHNSEKKRSNPNCSNCMSTLIKKVEESLKSGKETDLSVLKDCYKVVFTALPRYPINYLRDVLIKCYNPRYGNTTEFYGKFGGSGRGGSRVLFFYENTPEDVAERKKQLIELVEDKDLIGMVTEVKACDYMFNHINLDESLKSKVRGPEIFLQMLKEYKKAYDQGELK